MSTLKAEISDKVLYSDNEYKVIGKEGRKYVLRDNKGHTIKKRSNYFNLDKSAKSIDLATKLNDVKSSINELRSKSKEFEKRGLMNVVETFNNTITNLEKKEVEIIKKIIRFNK